MAAEDAIAGTGVTGEDSAMSETSGTALLLVIGEPFTADHKEMILERITKGKMFYFAKSADDRSS